MEKVTMDMTISDVLKIDNELGAIFIKNGMFCIGCAAAAGESVGEACGVHGVDAELLVGELNTFLTAKA